MKTTLIISVAFFTQSFAVVHDVEIDGFAFSPSSLEISQGDSVRWTNQDTTPHTTTSGITGIPDGNWDSDLLSQGEQFIFGFENTGEFPYYCIPHPFMTGNITVTDPLNIENNSVYAKSFNLYPAYPNPFNPLTTLSWYQDIPSQITVEIYNVKGSLIEEFEFAVLMSGYHQVDWQPLNQPSGIYLIKIEGQDIFETQKVIFSK